VDISIFKHDRKLLDSFKNEMKIMEIINNPYIIKLFDKIFSENTAYLITNYCSGGNLEDLI